MYLIFCLVVVFGSVIGGYMMHHGDLAVLVQPNEFVIIGGSGVGAFLLSNPLPYVKKALAMLKVFFKSGTPYKKDAYMELLLFQYGIFKFVKAKGMLEIESHIENPYESDFFNKFPKFAADHHAVDFFCDYFRLMGMGIDNHYILDDMMQKELDAHHDEDHLVGTAILTLGDSFPALGIVAAVLGVITTMGSISEPPEILGGLIGAALVGTFLGILLCYGVVGPMGNYVLKYFGEKACYMDCLKTGMLAHMQGNAAAVSVEFARKAIPQYVMPSFAEVEAEIDNAT